MFVTIPLLFIPRMIILISVLMLWWAIAVICTVGIDLHSSDPLPGWRAFVIK